MVGDQLLFGISYDLGVLANVFFNNIQGGDLSTNRQTNTKTPVANMSSQSFSKFEKLEKKKHVENLPKKMSIEKDRVKHFEKPTTQIPSQQIDLQKYIYILYIIYYMIYDIEIHVVSEKKHLSF